MIESKPSEKAIEAGETAAANAPGSLYRTAGRCAVCAAHDPALGPDRSVCLRDVVDLLRGSDGDRQSPGYILGDFIEREFGGGS